jgi:exosortase/archaeosortase family protein
MASAPVAPGMRAQHRYRRSRRSGRRLVPVLFDLALAAVICAVGFRYGAGLLQVQEARWVVGELHLLGVDAVSGSLPRHILVFRPDGEIIMAEVTRSCTSILSVLGLTALTTVVLRRRRLHAVAGLVVAVAALLLFNNLRLAGSVVGGLLWGTPALVLLHNWVGTVWNLAATLGGFLIMVYVTLPTAERAEQDLAGQHTARRPESWARPGLGYRLPEDRPRVVYRRWTLTGVLHRHVLPRRISRWVGARREAVRIDYRLGHLPTAERAERIRALAADGLGAHAASLVAVATYDDDLHVLDVLAEAVAARQWEPVTGHQVAALRLWARGWLLQHPARRAVPAADDTLPVLAALPRPRVPPARPRTSARACGAVLPPPTQDDR